MNFRWFELYFLQKYHSISSPVRAKNRKFFDLPYQNNFSGEKIFFKELLKKLDATPPNLEYVEANWHKFLKMNDTIIPKESHIKKGEDLKDSPKNLFRDFAFESLKAGENGRRAITHKIYIQILQRDILPYFGDMDIAEITSFKVKSWQNELLKKIKPQSLNNVRGVLNMIFNDALAEEIIDKNPLSLIKRPKADKTKINPFSLEEVKNIIAGADGWFKNYLTLAFFCGARIGEMLALKWEDIDFENNTIRINKAIRDGVISKPKTKASIRVIDMLPIVKNALLEQYQLTNNMGNVFVSKRNKGFKSSQCLLRVHWYSLLRKLNISKRTLYQTRHTFASIMISKGEDPVWVGCKMMGHENIAMTLSVYTKYIESKEKRATFLSDFIA
ncbi:hypothetical protein BKH42_03285 [Helicobacter sp. 13S00482-2]|uniref:tyrosine-type recombinase/integrase n=1 Tax=Helicobacter sp. 13S00482-2 TaxID=1476200 RepID=UPI000BA4ED1A|nr:tyrosine-type recombinase/integrase [Helicobacter sp. 13S00482-2]PAF54002.1 hypothetical protein BKH42_03285 [Helicobacter sp. 13S00482-2]